MLLENLPRAEDRAVGDGFDVRQWGKCGTGGVLLTLVL